MLIFVPLSHVDDNPFQRRAEYGDIEELAGRIAAACESYPETFGLMQVPRGRFVVRNNLYPHGEPIKESFKVPDDPKHWDKALKVQLAFGHRRLRAFQHLHTSGAPGYEDGRFPVHIDPLTNQQMLDAVWAENYERKDISAVEQAELIQLKLQQLGENATHAAIGAEWGLSRPVISNRLRLLELPEEVQQANREGRLSERQALALAPIAKIDDLTNGRVKWSKTHDTWGPPLSPAAYVERVLARPETTSDDIRDYTNRILKHAGADLTDTIATFKCNHSRVRQEKCKGCPARMNQSCLDSSCLDIKKEEFRTAELTAVSSETGYPISDREEDFKPFIDDSKLRDELRVLFKAGIEANFVIRWQSGNGYYPWSTGNEYYVYQHEYAGNRAAIALGHRGSLTPYLEQLRASQSEADDDAPEQPVVADIPDRETQKAWIAEAEKLKKAAEKAAKNLFVDALFPHASEDEIQALICDPEQEWIDDSEVLARRFVEFLWRHGSGTRLAYTPYRYVQDAAALLRRAGLEAPEISLRDQAVMALAFWGEHREYSWSRQKARSYLNETIDRLHDVRKADIDEELRQLRRALLRASADIAPLTPPGGMALWETDDIWECPACGEQSIAWSTPTPDGRFGSCAECKNEVWKDNEDNCYAMRLHGESAESEDDSYSFTDEMETFVQGVETAEPEPTEELTMTEIATEWLRDYQGDDGRTWQDLTPGQTHHANSPCYQAFVAAFPVEKEPKLLLKQARAQLERETAVAQEAS